MARVPGSISGDLQKALASPVERWARIESSFGDSMSK